MCMWCTAAGLEKHEPTPAESRARGQQLEGSGAWDYETFRERRAMPCDERPVVPGVEQQEQDSIRIAVAELEVETAFERLQVMRPSLSLDGKQPAPAGDDRIPCAQVAGPRQWHLCPKPKRSMESPPEPLEQRRVRCVAQGLPGRIGPDR